MTDVRGEAVASQQGIGLLSPAPWVGFSPEGGCAPLDEVEGRSAIGVAGTVFECGRAGCRGALLEDLRDDVVRHALALELPTQGDGAPWSGTVTRLDPRTREGRVIEVADLDKTVDDLIDDPGGVAEVDEAPTGLVHRA